MNATEFFIQYKCLKLSYFVVVFTVLLCIALSELSKGMVLSSCFLNDNIQCR